jgi:hypothetical protein
MYLDFVKDVGSHAAAPARGGRGVQLLDSMHLGVLYAARRCWIGPGLHQVVKVV